MIDIKARYYFEHVLLPSLFFANPQHFINLVRPHHTFQLLDKLEKVKSEYPLQELFEGMDCQVDFKEFMPGVFKLEVKMPEPEEQGLCHKVIFMVDFEGSLPVFITIEEGYGRVVLCSKLKDGTRINYGEYATETLEQDNQLIELYENYPESLDFLEKLKQEIKA